MKRLKSRNMYQLQICSKSLSVEAIANLLACVRWGLLSHARNTVADSMNTFHIHAVTNTQLAAKKNELHAQPVAGLMGYKLLMDSTDSCSSNI